MNAPRILGIGLGLLVAAVAVALLVQAGRETPAPGGRYTYSVPSGSPPSETDAPVADWVPAVPDPCILFCHGTTAVVAGATGVALHRLDGTPVGGFSIPAAWTAAAPGTNGSMLAACQDHVEVYSWQGLCLGRWAPLPGCARLTAVALSGSRVAAADAGNRRVWLWDLDGQPQGELPPPGASEGRFIVPSPYFDLAPDGAGGWWVTDPGRHRLGHWTAAGAWQEVWGQAGVAPGRFCGCCNPAHLAVGPEGTLVTSEKGLRRMVRFAPDGACLGIVAGTGRLGEGAEPLDVAVAGNGSVLALDRISGRVKVWVRQAGEPGKRDWP